MRRRNREETKWETYERLIVKRLPKALDEIRKVRTLFEQSFNYGYTKPEAQRVFTELFKAIKPISPVDVNIIGAGVKEFLAEDGSVEKEPQMEGENRVSVSTFESSTGRKADDSVQKTSKAMPPGPTEFPDMDDWKGLTPIQKSELAWAYDMLNYGDVRSAKKMIQRILFNMKDMKNGHPPGSTERRFSRK